MLSAFVDALGHNDVTAYLTMMAPRLVALRKVLKPTGSIYLHCDPTAGHYLKVLMDAVFGPRNFVNEIIWKRSDAHSDARQGARHFGRIHDSLLLYAADQRQMRFNTLHTPLPESTAENWYRYVEEGTGASVQPGRPHGGEAGRRYQLRVARRTPATRKVLGVFAREHGTSSDGRPNRLHAERPSVYEAVSRRVPRRCSAGRMG